MAKECVGVSGEAQLAGQEEIVLRDAHHALHGPSGAPCSVADDSSTNDRVDRVSRRTFVKGATLLTGAAFTGAPAMSAEAQAASSQATKPLSINLTINGEARQLSIDPRISLLDLLREQLMMTGTKKGCDHGQCGACTVLADGRRINSCLALAAVYDGASITTVEGLAHGNELHAVQQAFLDHDGFQCGYCTPGQITSAVGLLAEAKRGAASFVTVDLKIEGPVELTDAEIRERMSGNICRCGAYPGIVAAVRQAYSKA
jgi:xanthine dehydrogenase YagT iron-sulfur-binding subunit